MNTNAWEFLLFCIAFAVAIPLCFLPWLYVLRFMLSERKEPKLTPKERAKDLREWWVSQSESYHGGFDTMDGKS